MALFTDAAIERPENCERRDCRKLIRPGEPCFNVDDANGQVKLVCKDCNDYYKRKEANMTQRRQNTTITGSHSIPELDFQTMRQNVNESYRKGGHAPGGRVMALPAPKVSAHRYHSETPVTESRYRTDTSVIGYSAAHSQHAAQMKIWSERAYKGLSASQIGMVMINLFVFEPKIDLKGKPSMVDGIKESLRVSSDISTRELSRSIRHALLPPLHEFCGSIEFDIEKMIIRDASNGAWLKLETYSEVPYFGNLFLKPNPRKKDGTMIFSMPTNAKIPMFGLVFESSVWKQIEAIREAELYGHSSPNRAGPTAALLNAIGLRPKRKASTSSINSVRKVARSHTSTPRPVRRQRMPLKNGLSDAEDNSTSGNESSEPELIRPAPRPVRHRQQSSEITEGDKPTLGNVYDGNVIKGGIEMETDTPCYRREAEQVETEVSGENSDASEGTQKRTSVSEVERDSGVKEGEPLIGKFIPFNIDTIRRGFLEGGINSKSRKSENDDFVWEPILFIDLPQPTFKELIMQPTELEKALLSVNAKVIEAHIRYDARPEAFLGKGSFKTTSLARLTFKEATPISSAGLGKLVSTSSDRTIAVALKRPYRTKLQRALAASKHTRRENISEQAVKPSKVGGIGRLLWNEEQHVVFEECKLLVWANSLLTSAYDFISHFIHNQADSPPFEIPRFRFVVAGMAIALKPLDNKGKNPSTNRSTYLLEELIDRAETHFVKYIHNGSAISDLSPEHDDDYHLAEFLMFIQHVQYMITGGVAYVSDFQGVGLLLTDPQILTTPLLGNDLFGDGNLGEAFERFPEEHKCTKHCEWFKLDNPSERRKKLKKNIEAKKQQRQSSSDMEKSQPTIQEDV